ncbi:MAG TPA: hypothetical protein VIK33_10080 [Anaerolineae bacterium]
MPKGKLLSREARLRANGLLDMLYTPAEMADELGIQQRDVYEKLLPAGLPHQRDETGHLWLHGPEVAHWVRTLRAGRRLLGDNEAYCLKCRAVVRLVRPKRVKRGKFTLLQALCPTCGTTVNRGVKGKKR